MPETSYLLIGTYMIVLFVLGVVENGIVIVAYLSNKRLRTVNNSFIVGLSVDNLLMIVLTFPQITSSSFEGEWLSGHSGCIFMAFCASASGLAQITLLTLTAIDRYLIIVKQIKLFSKNVWTALASMTFCYVYAIGWAMGPLFGWSEYELETGDISCSVSWRLKEANNISYTLGLFTFVWFIPLFIIAFSYTNILWLVNRKKKPGSGMLVSNSTRSSDSSFQRKSKERQVSMTVLLMIGAFVVSWLPYSIVSFWSAIGDVNSIPFGAILTPALIAKSSVIWNPIIYLSRHREFRRHCLKYLSCCRRDKALVVSVTEAGQANNESKCDYRTIQCASEHDKWQHERKCSVKNKNRLELFVEERSKDMDITAEISLLNGNETPTTPTDGEFINETCID